MTNQEIADQLKELADLIDTLEKRQGGFEHDGVWIEDRTKSPCGRFDLTPEQSDETYGK
jgi:hypothetical protein